MEKRLVFDADREVDRTRYTTLWDGVILGGSRGEAKTRQELRRYAKIQRALKAIGQITTDFDPRLRPPDPLILAPGTHEVVLEQGEIEDIEKRLEKVPWGGQMEIAVADLFDFLSAAPIVEPAP